ncbi:MAG: DUF885 domain-containing protein [bacterium]|nr:DUF885 domain-containing protein [bacterium]
MKRKMNLRMGTIATLVWIGLLAVASACSRAPEAPPEAPPAAEESPTAVRHLADEYMDAFLDRFPETGTYYGIPGRRHDRLTDNSLAALASWQAREDAWLDRLAELQTPVPGSPDWTLHGVLLETLEAALAMRICRDELWTVSEVDGWQTWLPFIAEIQPVGTEEQRREALARSRELARYLDTEIANLREGLQLGYSAPKRNVGLVAKQVRGLLAPESPLRSPAQRDDAAAFQAAFTEVIEQEVEPALRRYAEFLEAEYQDAAREVIAVAENPDGAECYRASVRHHATVELPPQEIHDLGLEQMALIQREMLEVAEGSFGTRDVPALLKRLTTEPEYAFASREEIIRYSQDAVERAREAMPRFFRLLPRADVVIEPYPAYREEGGTGEYQSPSEDGSRPGVYYIPVVDPEKRPRVGYESLAFHEVIPGHHLQLAIAIERTGSHPLARYLDKSGYSEGWGLYSERLADEMGLYSSDLARLGMLGDQAARAARLVIDTGIHELGWSRQQAIDYMIAHTTWAPQDVEAEVDRYIVWPGQANAYMLGMLKIRELRERAEEALGESFDVRDFHDRVLEDGAVTLGMLERKIDHWISTP